MDGGSTHNFLLLRLVNLINFPISRDKQFPVMVGNEATFQCEGMCAAVPVRIQKHVCLVDFFVLSIQGADLVLGVQLLQLLGPILLDYLNLIMEFTWEQQAIRL